MKTTIHICISVSGALANFKKKDWQWIALENNSTPALMKEKFRIMEFEGKEVIPFGEPCEGFSYKTGCPGHPQQDS